MGIGLNVRGRSERAGWIGDLRERLTDLAHPAAEGRRDASAEELVEAAPAEGEVLTRRDDAVVKKAYLRPGDDGVILSTRNAVDGKLCVSTIVFPDEAARGWAMQAWASLRCR